LREVGKYYNQAESSTSLGTSPYALAANGGACQQSFAIVMTDGYWNGGTPSVGNQDGDQGSPYADSYSDTLADVAMMYYKTDLSSTLENEVPTNPCDPATRQHMVTYGVSFGVTGSLDPAAYHHCLLDGGTPVWPDPTSAYRYKIDDLYHATINGHGVFFSASNPEELVSALEDLMENIESRMASGASVSVNGEELGSDTVLYQASYTSGGWVGEVKAYPVDPQTGEILREDSDVLWSAADELQGISADDRLIATYNGTSSGAAFRYDALSDAQKAALDTDYATDPSLAQNIVNYIRGAEITGFRSRTRKLGDIVHSAPLFLGNTIYVGGNDGMLHAFDADTGRERFGYVPNLVFENLKHLTDTSYSHLFFVDLTTSAQVNVPMGVDSTGTMLVGGLAKGGKGYFALDITNADSLDSSSSESDVAAMVKWEYPKAGVTDNDMGYSFSRAFIVKTYSVDHPWVVIFGNGYNSANGKAVLYILDVDGTLVRKLDTGVGSANGLSTPSLVDVNADYRVDYAYAGDLNGNLWKFDLRDADHVNWNVAYGVDNNSDEKIVFADGDEPKPLFSAPGKPITIKPDVMRHCDKEGYIVVFGTGLYLGTDDRTNQSVQTVYGIWDYGDDADNAEYLGMFSSGFLSNQTTNVTLLEQEELPQSPVTLYGHRIRLTTNYTPNWETLADSTEGQDPDPGSAESPPNTVHAGWYFDLPDPGERVIKDLMIRDGMAVFTSFTPNSSPCAGGGNSMVHEMNACTGARPLPETPQFDINDDGVIDDNDRVNLGDDDNPDWVSPTGKEFVGLLHPPVVLTMPDRRREMKVFSTSAGTTVTLMERGERRGIFYWVERTGP
jgi:Tfp pilus tip-associated adhesin PilY1